MDRAQYIDRSVLGLYCFLLPPAHTRARPFGDLSRWAFRNGGQNDWGAGSEGATQISGSSCFRGCVGRIPLLSRFGHGHMPLGSVSRQAWMGSTHNIYESNYHVTIGWMGTRGFFLFASLTTTPYETDGRWLLLLKNGVCCVGLCDSRCIRFMPSLPEQQRVFNPPISGGACQHCLRD